VKKSKRASRPRKEPERKAAEDAAVVVEVIASGVLNLGGEMPRFPLAVDAVFVDERPTILRLGPGLHRGISEADYHARVPGMASTSILRHVRRSPAHYRAWLLGELQEEQSEALDLGRAVHCAALEPERFAIAYAVRPTLDRRTKDGKAEYAAWQAEHPGAVAISESDATTIGGVVRSLHAHPVAAALLEDGESEVTIRWTDPATGIECRARADRLSLGGRVCADLKSTTDARARKWSKSAADFHYFRQAAFYIDGLAAAGEPLEEDEDGPRYLFIAAEKAPPYAVSVFRLDPAALALGRRTIGEDLATLARSIERDEWPAYGEGIEILSLPSWTEREW
jgi:hypothetical protein